MKNITKDMFQIIEKQIYNRARDLEVAMYNTLFLDMPKEMVLDAISMYQNRDGGFGKNLEMDNYNPNSSPAVTNEALQILKMVGFNSQSNDEFLTEVLNKTFNYLYNRALLVDNKWPFAIKSNNDYPCAVWWKYQEDKIESYNPTASLIGYTLFFLDENKPYYKKALKMLEPCINYYLSKEIADKHEIMCYMVLLDCLKEKNIIIANLDELADKIVKDSYEIIEKNKEGFSKPYPTMPLDLFYDGSDNPVIKELIEDNLDYLIDSIKPHGLWDPTWQWHNDYPEQEAALIKWIGRISVNNLWLLKKFKRIED